MPSSKYTTTKTHHHQQWMKNTLGSPESEMMMMMMSSEGDGKNVLKMCFISSKSYSYNMYKKNHPIIIVSWSFREGCVMLSCRSIQPERKSITVFFLN